MKRLYAALFVSALVSTGAAASGESVLLDYRLQPRRDLSSVEVSEMTTTVRVVEDRGIVAKSNGRLTTGPMALQITSRQDTRLITSPPAADGSFSVEVRMTRRTVTAKEDAGREQKIETPLPEGGLAMVAVVEQDGKIRANSLTLTGAPAEVAEPLRTALAKALEQATLMEPITLTRGAFVPQDMSLPFPIPGFGLLEMKTRTLNRLLGVDAGVARIEQVVNVEFTAGGASLKSSGQGSGGGTMLYEPSTRTLLSSEGTLQAKVVIDLPDGVLQIDVQMKQDQKMRNASAGSS